MESSERADPRFWPGWEPKVGDFVVGSISIHFFGILQIVTFTDHELICIRFHDNERVRCRERDCRLATPEEIASAVAEKIRR
jgi:hypothetical protein